MRDGARAGAGQACDRRACCCGLQSRSVRHSWSDLQDVLAVHAGPSRHAADAGRAPPNPACSALAVHPLSRHFVLLCLVLRFWWIWMPVCVVRPRSSPPPLLAHVLVPNRDILEESGRDFYCLFAVGCAAAPVLFGCHNIPVQSLHLCVTVSFAWYMLLACVGARGRGR